MVHNANFSVCVYFISSSLHRNTERFYCIPHLEGQTLNVITRVEARADVIFSTFENYFPNEIAKVDSDHDPYPPWEPAPA